MEKEKVTPIIMEALLALTDDGKIDAGEGLRIVKSAATAAGFGIEGGAIDLDITDEGHFAIKTDGFDLTIKKGLLEKLKIGL